MKATFVFLLVLTAACEQTHLSGVPPTPCSPTVIDRVVTVTATVYVYPDASVLDADKVDAPTVWIPPSDAGPDEAGNPRGVPCIRWGQLGSCIFYSDWPAPVLDYLCEDLQVSSREKTVLCECLGLDWNDEQNRGLNSMSFPLCPFETGE